MNLATLTEWWDRRKREQPFRRTDSRCYKCGFLGAYFKPPGTRAIPIAELAEIRTNSRRYWESELNRLRREGKIVHEFDPRQGQASQADDSAAFGVSCGVGQSQGAGSSWFVGKDDFFRGGGVLVEDPERPFIKHGLGAATGKVSTDLWSLVRPHDCKEFIPHRAGLTPLEHLQVRSRNARGLIARFVDSPIAKLIAWIAGLGGLAWLISWIRALLE